MIIKKPLSALLSLVLIAAVIASAAPAASAVDATYKASEQYKAEKYYKNLTALTLTGDQACDVVAVALTQLGYLEGDSNDGLGGVVGGNRDFVEYNVMYGKIDNNQGNGLSYGYYWCASFVNWCLRQAGVSKEASATGEISCRRWLSACKNADIYLGKDIVPETGDLIFFKDAGSEVTSTHMGIVRYSDGETVYTVEGNTVSEEYSSEGDRVALKAYSLDSSYIVGYARPKYEKNTDAKVDFLGKYFTRGLCISKEDISIFSEDALEVEAGIVGENTVFTVTDILDGIVAVSYEKDGNVIKGFADISGKAIQLSSTETACRITLFDSDGETSIGYIYADEGKTVDLTLSRIAQSDRGLVGWTLERDGEAEDIAYDGEMTVAEDGSLTAIWDSTQYEIKFVTEEGEILSTVTAYYGDTIASPEVSAAEGYEFIGWQDFSPAVKSGATYVALFEKLAKETEALTKSTEESSAVETRAYEPDDQTLIPALYGCRAAATSASVITVFLPAIAAITARKKKKDKK